ncbi:MAG TPA: 3'-5' exonuclease [Burkholderiaceae bacterium]|nr:3'-5' exonuclease [Burkholderiaceae bacterium]
MTEHATHPSHDTRHPSLLQGLNAEQLQAVTLGNGHALVLAGAGSGKTRVLTTRMAWLMQTGQVGPGGLMAVTFTNKAAKEMLTRLQAMLPVNVRGMWVGTFHGLCNRLLRAHWKPAGLPQTFQILDTQDQLSAVKRLCKQYNVDDERFPPKQLVWFIAGCKEEGMRPADVPVRDDDTRKKVEIYQLYEDQCQREGVVDFGELMLRSFELLRDHADIREHYQRRFRHVLVDEFQDTNKLQYAWLKQLVGSETAVLAVGDDDQSIYAFRGARVGNMADFLREFPGVSQVKLEQNYRSHSNILDAANELIGNNSQRLGKNLRTDQGAGEPIRVYESPTDFDEARWVVDEVRQLVRGKGSALGHGPNGAAHADPEQHGYPRKEIAVLYRSNAQSRAIETALMNAAVPYKVYGGLRFFERAEIKHALAYLRLLENPRDDTSFLRVVNFPPRGIGARSIEQLQDVARSSGCALFDAVSAVKGRAGVGLTAFVAKLDVMREATQGQTLRQIVATVLDQSGLLVHFQNDRDGADRVENLEELVNAAESFVMQEGFGRDAVALPLDETGAPGGGLLRDGKPGPGLTQSPVSQGLVPPSRAQSANPLGATTRLSVNPEDALADALQAANEAAAELGDVGMDLQDAFDFDSLPTTRPVVVPSEPAGQVGRGAGVNAQASADPNWADALDTGLLAVLPEETGETLSPLVAFLTHAALEAGDNQAQAGQDAVQLMTVHAAKGLEFDCVFITGLEEGLFPHENSASDRASLEEERRLMYVAITRARKRLYITHSQTRMLHGQTRYNLRSRFLDELPETCLRWLTPRAGGMGFGQAGGGFAPAGQTGGFGYGSGAGRPWGAGQGGSGASLGGAKKSYSSSPGGQYGSDKPGAFAPAPEPKSGRGSDISAGMKVFHAKFGEGKVLTVEGAAADARAQINFPRHGVKWLALGIAKLTVVDD